MLWVVEKNSQQTLQLIYLSKYVYIRRKETAMQFCSNGLRGITFILFLAMRTYADGTQVYPIKMLPH